MIGGNRFLLQFFANAGNFLRGIPSSAAVFARGTADFAAKYFGKIIAVVIAGALGYFGNKQTPVREQFFRLIDPDLRQIFEQ